MKVSYNLFWPSEVQRKGLCVQTGAGNQTHDDSLSFLNCGSNILKWTENSRQYYECIKNQQVFPGLCRYFLMYVTMKLLDPFSWISFIINILIITFNPEESVWILFNTFYFQNMNMLSQAFQRLQMWTYKK